MLRLTEINEIRSLAPLRARWNELCRATVEASFFHSLEWLEAYWRHYGATQTLRVLSIADGDEPIGFVPLAVVRERSPFGMMRVLTYPFANWGSYYGPIGPRPAECLTVALRHVMQTPRRWDLLDLRFAPPADFDPAQSAESLHTAGIAAHTKPSDRTSLVDLPATYADYLAGRTSKWRMNVRRWERRLAECGTVRFERYRPEGSAAGDDDPRWDLYDRCEQIAQRSWQGSASDGTTITHDEVRPFLREAHEAACRAGTADLSLLYVDERPLAFLYAYRYHGRIDALRTGYDPTGPQAGVGNLLYMRVIEDSIARGDRLLDLGPNYFAAKKPFVTRTEDVLRHTWGNPRTVRGALWHAKRFCESRFPQSDSQLASPAAAEQAVDDERIATAV